MKKMMSAPAAWLQRRMQKSGPANLEKAISRHRIDRGRSDAVDLLPDIIASLRRGWGR